MLRILRGGECYSPEYMGKKDILLAFERICAVEDEILPGAYKGAEIVDCAGKLVCPGIIDQHIHFTGGGGENGPASRVPEIRLCDIISAGVTTAVGLLGVDSITRSLETLLAKAESLESEGLTTYIYTGSYSVPTATLIGKPIKDIALIKKVIGIGEIAISDNRSSNPSLKQLKELSYEAFVGGMLGGKAGVLHMHVGDGKGGLSLLFKLLEETDFPYRMFVPTHLNRNRDLFEQAIRYAKQGGNIDLTAGQPADAGVTIPDALERLLREGVEPGCITLSSDGNGSLPDPGSGGVSVGKVTWLLDDIRSCVLDKGIGFDIVIRLVTRNVAELLKLYPGKGVLQEGSFGDVLVLNREDMSIDKLFAMGNLMVENGKPVKRGSYEGT